MGFCGVRECSEAEGGLKLFTLNYGEITSIALDAVKKKPLYHFYPDGNILSIGTFGCNFKCSFCQNYSISQYRPESQYVPAEEMADISLKNEGSIGLAFTYNEPSIWYEYVYDVAREIKSRNKEHKIVLVTNGYINQEPLKQLLPYVDAMNIDLKGDEEFYTNICLGKMEPVMDTIRLADKEGCHIEVTTLLIPGENNSYETLDRLGKFLESVNNDIVLHVSRFFPRYRMKKQATDIEEMKKAYRQLKTRLNNVYAGNISNEEMAYITKQ
jgi:pyruvate formate lyase activating enzyme